MRENVNKIIEDLKRDNFKSPVSLKKRFRKKFHLGEYQQLGFEVKINFKKPLDEKEFTQFTNNFLEQAVEKNDLLFGGGGSGETGWRGVLHHNKNHCSATAEQK